jgi:hypothetical protein
VTWALVGRGVLAALKWAWANWKPLSIALLALLLVRACHDRDAAIEAKGKAEAVAASVRADSVKLAVLAKAEGDSIAQLGAQISQMHEGYDQDIAHLRLSLGRVDTLALERWMHDTVQVAGDTVKIAIPAAAVRQADSALHACSEIANTCDQFKAMALKRFATDSLRLLNASTPKPETPGRRWWGFDATAGYGVVKDGSGKHKGPGALFGLSIRF